MISVVGPLCDDSAQYLSKAFSEQHSLMIALDGGIKTLLDFDIEPILWIGDMDSTKEETLEEAKKRKIPAQKFPREKDCSDFELAVKHILCYYSPQPVHLYGMLGGRLDHMMFNIEVAKTLAKANYDLSFQSEKMDVYILYAKQVLGFDSFKGNLVSILPWESNVEFVSTQGLRYPLNHDILVPMNSRGLSNISDESRVEIKIESGSLMVFHIKEVGI